MPHTRSAKKRLRQNLERRTRNRDRTTEIKTLRKKIDRAVHDGQTAEAETLYREFAKRVDQAASTNTLHRNAAARLKSRTAIRLRKPQSDESKKAQAKAADKAERAEKAEKTDKAPAKKKAASPKP